MFRTIVLIASCLFLLTACALFEVEPQRRYSRSSLVPIERMDRWAFSGRLALSSKKDGWSASIDWLHDAGTEEISLSGPLGQGATRIRLTESLATIDRGNGDVRTSAQPEEFVNRQLGVFVPVHSLRYWVVGWPEPDRGADETDSGFRQSGWLVEYAQMQSVGDWGMPRKITVSNGQVKLKLIIDQWDLGL